MSLNTKEVLMQCEKVLSSINASPYGPQEKIERDAVAKIVADFRKKVLSQKELAPSEVSVVVNAPRVYLESVTDYQSTFYVELDRLSEMIRRIDMLCN